MLHERGKPSFITKERSGYIVYFNPSFLCSLEYKDEWKSENVNFYVHITKYER